ncbi:hypothetical protein Vafri_11937 [Volvox africanus]|uniref:Protein kinase domain-containing protein n=1 Tax=Volvox africanus TaxID=51714 RepID=A0A8J4F4V7_9CHLO|nr:hypothetical protein Vafri_11937 [Volvox africanus]
MRSSSPSPLSPPPPRYLYSAVYLYTPASKTSTKPVVYIPRMGLTYHPPHGPYLLCHGQVAYMAPEVLNTSNRIITHRVDIYAFGVILWEMLAGVRPWAGFEMVQVAASVALGRQRPPLGVLSTDRCPPRLKALIQSCWDGDPGRRPAAAEVVKELLLVQMKLRRNDTGSRGEI